MNLKGEPFQLRNDPFTRRSLHFNEIKDFDKYIDIHRIDVNVPGITFSLLRKGEINSKKNYLKFYY